MGNWIAGIVLLAVLIAAIVYVVRAKKSGRKCIGCPDGGCCPSGNGRSTGDSPCGGCCRCSSASCDATSDQS